MAASIEEPRPRPARLLAWPLNRLPKANSNLPLCTSHDPAFSEGSDDPVQEL
jgi:hypothetical protein